MAKRTALIELLIRSGNSKKNLSNLQKDMTRLSEVSENVGLKLDKSLKQGFSATNLRRIDQFEKKMNMGTHGAKRTGTAVMNLGRIVQDAPFGMMGVANNIEPFITSFQRMGDEAMGARQKIMMLLKGAFTGPNALITLTSVATSAFLAYQMGFFDWGEEAKKLEEDLSGVIEEMQTIIRIQEQFGAFDDDEFGMERRRAEIREISEVLPDLNKKLQRAKELEEQRLQLGYLIADPNHPKFKSIEQELKHIGEVDELEESIFELEKRRLELSKEMVDISKALSDEDTKQARAEQEKAKAKEKQAKLQKKIVEARSIEARRPTDSIIGANIDPGDPGVGTDEGSIEAQKQKIKDLQKAFEATPFAQGRNQIAEKIKEARKELEAMQEPLDEVVKKQSDFGERAAESFGQAGASALLYSDNVQEAGRAIVSSIVNQIVANAILTAFNPPTPASLALAPIAAAAAQKIVGQFLSFRGGVDDFEGGVARVHKDEMIVGLPGGSSVLTNQNVERLDRLKRQATEGASNLGGVQASVISSAVKDAIKEGFAESDIRAGVDVSYLDRELQKLKEFKKKHGL